MSSSTSGANGSRPESGPNTNSATVSANDFLTLLVTEMKNQDPTANTDPNEYINQLVNVNSLEQLIGINQTLTTALGSPSSSSNDGASPRVKTDASSDPNSVAPATRPLHATPSASATPAEPISQASSIFGNLSAPQVNPAAVRVGHSLAQRTHAIAPGSIPPANQ
jgi:flagellar basal-body rod modification protein FlgD